VFFDKVATSPEGKFPFVICGLPERSYIMKAVTAVTAVTEIACIHVDCTPKMRQ
jgi:hypothetical protein